MAYSIQAELSVLAPGSVRLGQVTATAAKTRDKTPVKAADKMADKTRVKAAAKTRVKAVAKAAGLVVQ